MSKNTTVSSREFDMRVLFGLIINVNKDSSFKAKARTKDSSFVLKDNQGPRTKAKDNILAIEKTRSPTVGSTVWVRHSLGPPFPGSAISRNRHFQHV